MYKRIGLVLLLFAGALLFPAGPAEGAGDDNDWAWRLEPLAREIAVNGDERGFRKDWWMTDGPAGGLDHLAVDKILGDGYRLKLEGRAIAPERDYQLSFNLNKKDFGYLRLDYKEFRKYFDDSGGFFRTFSTPAFQLGKDLHLDIGSLILEAGTDHDEGFNITLGYEHHFKDGEKSLLEWGRITESGLSRNIFPSFKRIDEQVDIFKIGLDYKTENLFIGDQFQVEKYIQNNERFDNEANLSTGRAEDINVAERYKYDAYVNSFRIENHLGEQIFLSFGHLYSKHDGNAGVRVSTVPFGPEPFDHNWFTRFVNIDQEGQLANLNAVFGPYHDFTVNLGLKAETVDTSGNAEAVLTDTRFGGGIAESLAVLQSRQEKNGLEEIFGIRYKGFKRTTIYAEGKWSQQDIDLFERDEEEGALNFERLTDTRVERERYTFGFATSPFRRVSLSGRYRHQKLSNDYDHLIDATPGYSAFIIAQESETDQINFKLTIRPITKVQTILEYNRTDTDIDTITDTNPPGTVQSGRFRSDCFNVHLTYTPASNFYVSGLFSFRNVASTAFDNNIEAVVPYSSDVFSSLLSAAWLINNKTRFDLGYLYSVADNFEDNSAFGLPLGVDNKRHRLLLDISYKFKENITTKFGYGYYRYEDESNAGMNDYDAHVFRFGCEFTF